MKEGFKGSALLLTAAFLWGMSFVASKEGLASLDVYTFTALRSLAACILLFFVVIVAEWKKKKAAGSERSKDAEDVKSKKEERKVLLLGGICCGAALFLGMIVQQFGLVTVDAGKGGFLTALYIVMVPLMGVAIGHKISKLVLLSLPCALAGLWLLTVKDGLTIGKGELLIIICAFFYAVHILVVGYFSPKTDPLKMSLIQFIVVTLLCSIPMFLFEEISMTAIMQTWLPILYGGAISNGIGFTLQLVAQKDVHPMVAGVLLSMESCFAVLGGCVLLHEHMAGKEILGCVLMFAAVILAQLPSGTSKPVKASGDADKEK